MAEFKIVISDPKTGKSYQREIKEDAAASLIGMKIGYTVKGESLDLQGYEFEITGGSDKSGFPMRRDVPGAVRKRIFAVEGVGIKKKDKGIKQRKTVCGNTISASIAQVNLKITKYGKGSLEPVAGEKSADSQSSSLTSSQAQMKEEKPVDKKTEAEGKEKAKEEPKKEEKAEDKPAEKKKEEVKEEKKEEKKEGAKPAAGEKKEEKEEVKEEKKAEDKPAEEKKE